MGSEVTNESGVVDEFIDQLGSEGLPAILDALVSGVARARLVGNGGSTGTGTPSSGTPNDGAGDPTPGGGAGGAIVLGALVLGGGAFMLARRRGRRRQEAAELEEVEEQVRDELVELGEGI